ncbi:TadE/TadG family type IV pilus assembly protein [Nocardioides gansuensis]|uniref:TadE/TadG family type IV pilus assembly protein n=1 Tax=Nocardioides gansuensis TaxID=2138300 RepID=UPI001401DC7E|nr:TadE/TadG family type IV pilus assembly protein [Nocardioides gansuensis]
MSTRRAEAGSAVVDFVLVLAVLLPLFLGILQLALVLHIRNTFASAAAEGARAAAVAGATPQDGIDTAASHLGSEFFAEFAKPPVIRPTDLGGAPAYEVTIEVEVPALGLGGPAVGFTVSGNAVRELP